MGILARSSILLFRAFIADGLQPHHVKKNLGFPMGKQNLQRLLFSLTRSLDPASPNMSAANCLQRNKKPSNLESPGTPVTWMGEGKSVSGSIVVSQPFRVGQSSCLRFSPQVEKRQTK